MLEFQTELVAKEAARRNGRWKTTVEMIRAEKTALLLLQGDWNFVLREMSKSYRFEFKPI